MVYSCVGAERQRAEEMSDSEMKVGYQRMITSASLTESTLDSAVRTWTVLPSCPS